MALFTLDDLEADSKISRHTWRMWIRAGKLPTIRAGRTVRVDESDYQAFLERCRVPAREEATR
jgi:excisionase family DNA binding protein